MTRIENYIGGQFSGAESGDTLPLIDPSINENYGSIPASGADDMERAVHAASQAFEKWGGSTPAFRSDWLNRLADGIQDRLETFAEAESRDNGKPVSLARTVDIPRAIANFRFFAGAILHDSSDAYTDTPGVLNYTLRHPLGVVGCISPWNLPLYLFSWKIAPALAAGNCVVGKPSEVTPLTAYLLAQTCDEIGFPEGVLNIVHGSGPSAGAAIVAHKDVRAISFTGGTATGRVIAKSAGEALKKVSLELGGKNPTIIFADANLDEAIDGAVRAGFSNQGQICLCGSRILIERSVYDDVRDRLVEAVSDIKVGDPLLAETKMGAIVSEDHLNKIIHHLSIARSEGGVILCGGERIFLKGRCENGFFFSPTLIEGLAASCETNQEEIFGPVATLLPFDDENEAIQLANGTPYGLAASVWTTNLETAHRVGHELQSGIVWVNCWMPRDLRTPFGGNKNSGMGREGGFHALRFFTEPKNITIKTA